MGFHKGSGTEGAVNGSGSTPISGEAQPGQQPQECLQRLLYWQGTEEEALPRLPLLDGEVEVETVRCAAPELLSRYLTSSSYAAVVVSLPRRADASLLNVLRHACANEQTRPMMLVAEPHALDNVDSAVLSDVEELCLIPFEAAEFGLRLRRLLQASPPKPEPELRALKERLGLQSLIGESQDFARVVQRLPLLAKSDATLLIRGETGTGKEVIARALHYLSPRSRGPFVPVNCGAIPSDLVENELFGHESGAFTNAISRRQGLVRDAEGGTLFLDEVDSLPLAAQVKVLRLLQEREYRPLGGRRVVQADTRILASSNAPLEEQLESGRFRRDLYYRLNVLAVDLPPLRERGLDALLLAEHFLKSLASRYNRPKLRLTPLARRHLLHRTWPGNVRELENAIERAVVLCRDDAVSADSLQEGRDGNNQKHLDFRQAKAEVIERFERDYIKRLLTLHGGNISHAARTAGKNRRAFFELIRKYQIRPGSFAGKADS